MMKILLVFVTSLFVLFLFPEFTIAEDNSNGFVNELFENDSMNDNETETDEAETIESPPATESNLLGGDNNMNPFIIFVQIILALGVILGLIYLLLKLFNRNGKLSKHGEMLENYGGVSLGSNKSMQIIRIGKQFFVVGVGENVEMLTEITDEETKTTLLQEREESQLQANQIIETIGNKFKRMSNKTQSDQHEKTSDPFASMFKNELHAMKEKRKMIRDQQKEEDTHE
ncbi:flagellar protein FliO/FliZ [Natronobacillus azotifigens]|uniref:Flagellar biosynthetic protein FliO n=1 Tax=Natronobacillus azotifigens TaxID=472978 RepID=A0A9J6RB35_9BACI|nr:flagellar biosynthetic protein FliO [Natronobacillus azotifigens]MCZ0702574.1 flagellar biosynthetic protein FliO [Natronobacillus azotifigens]